MDRKQQRKRMKMPRRLTLGAFGTGRKSHAEWIFGNFLIVLGSNAYGSFKRLP
jgi:hypothetical protein